MSLFIHDEDIIRNFQSQIDTVNKHIATLEEKLKVSSDECEDLRSRLYQSENTTLNERQGRTTFQRHLYVEQSRHSECARANHLLRAQHVQMKAEIDAACAFNAELRQEINHHENIIRSLASKISEYQGGADGLIPALTLGANWLGNRGDSPTLGEAHDQGSDVEIVPRVATLSPKRPAAELAGDEVVGRVKRSKLDGVFSAVKRESSM